MSSVLNNSDDHISLVLLSDYKQLSDLLLYGRPKCVEKYYCASGVFIPCYRRYNQSQYRKSIIYFQHSRHALNGLCRQLYYLWRGIKVMQCFWLRHHGISCLPLNYLGIHTGFKARVYAEKIPCDLWNIPCIPLERIAKLAFSRYCWHVKERADGWSCQSLARNFKGLQSIDNKCVLSCWHC